MNQSGHLLGRVAVVATLSATTVLMPGGSSEAQDVLSWGPVATGPGTLSGATAVPMGAEFQMWAVGSTTDPDTGRTQALVGHGYGYGGFLPVPAAEADPELDVELSGVDSAGDDVWAVGRIWSESGSGTRIERYNRLDPESGGRVQPSPSPDQNSTLLDIDMLSVDDGWAVGAAGPRTLVLNWDGTAWTEVPSPGTGRLEAVAARARDDVWAVGRIADPGPAQTLVLHWDGIAWTAFPSPNPATGANTLLGVALAGNDIWAVGYGSTDAEDLDESQRRAVALRWDGSTWQVLQSQSDGVTEFTDVTASSETDVTVAGYLTVPTETASLEHWDGTELHNSSFGQLPGGHVHVASALEAIASGPSGNPLWAVGWLRSNLSLFQDPAILAMYHWD